MSVTTTKGKEGGVGETVRVIVHALIIALVIRTFLFQPFNIPSGSMKATLLVGDYLFVSKYSYGYSHYSFPFSPPVFSGRILASPPDRGDVVVFRLPKDDSTDYIKRVIGLPGDVVNIHDGQVFISGVELNEPYLAGPPSYAGEWTVNAGEVFVLGDNRDYSSDSQNWGNLDQDDIIGRAVLVYWPPKEIGLIPHYDLAAAAQE